MPKIEIKDEQYRAFAERAEEKGFESADTYIHYVLDQVFERLESDRETALQTHEQSQQMKERLQSLGYLDGEG